MDIRQDPNSIPNFGGGGRIGEARRDEPEQAQSSVQLDSEAEGGDGPAASAPDSRLDDDSSATAKPGQVTAAGAGRTATGSDRDAGQDDPSARGPGAIDGHVGAP